MYHRDVWGSGLVEDSCVQYEGPVGQRKIRVYHCCTRFCSSTDFVQIEQKWLGQQPFLFIC